MSNLKISSEKIDILKIFAQNILCGCTLDTPRLTEAVLTSTHNVCFGSKIRKLGIPLQTPVFLHYIKVGFTGLYISRTCFPDDLSNVGYKCPI